MEQPRANSYYEAVWVAGGVFHVFNSAVALNRLFVAPAHYRYFVELLLARVTPFAEVFAYALLPNHLHLALRLRSEGELRRRIEAKSRGKRFVNERRWLAGQLPYHRLIGDYWATFFAMYASYYNPLVGRRGTLFDQTVRRIRVRADLLSRRLIMYIHTNEVKHGLLGAYDRSGLRTSFAYYGRERDDHWLARGAVLERFGGQEAFYRAHEDYVRKYGRYVSAFDERLYFAPPGGSPLEEAPYYSFLEDAPLGGR